MIMDLRPSFEKHSGIVSFAANAAVAASLFQLREFYPSLPSEIVAVPAVLAVITCVIAEHTKEAITSFAGFSASMVSMMALCTYNII